MISTIKSKQSKVPKKFPEYLAKCSWDATAITIIVRAKDEIAAWHAAWRKVARMWGGDWCLTVKILGRKT